MKQRYTKFNEEVLKGTFNLMTGIVKAIAVDSGYTVNIDTDDFMADIPSGSRLAISAALTGKSVTDGVFSFDDPTWPALTSTNPVDAVVYVFGDTATPATARLIHYDDEATGLPKTTNGSDVTHVVADGLFEI